MWWGRGLRIMAVPENPYLRIMVCNGNLGFSITSSVNIACINEKQYFILPYSKIVIVFAHEMCMLHKTNPVQAPFFPDQQSRIQ